MSTRIFSQDTLPQKNSFFIEAIVNSGKIVQNYPTFPKNNFSMIGEINLGWQTMGTKAFHHIYGFPQLGISFVYAYQGNDVVLGRTYAVMPNISFHAWRKEKSDLEFRIGSGFAYFPVMHHPTENPTNTLIGSHITDISSFSLNYRRKLNKKLQLKLGASTFHFSNGHYQLPNIGINSIVFTTGLKYFPNELKTLPERKKIAKEKHPLLFNIRFGLGVHEFGNELGPVGGPKYAIYATSFSVSKRLGRVSNVHAGLMSKYYTNYYEYIVDSNVYKSNQHLKASTFVFFLGHEFMCGKMSLLTQGGINLYNPFYKYYEQYRKNNVFKFAETYFCSRLGFQYYFFKPTPERRFNIYTGIFINANFGQADYDEISVGISF